MEDELEYYRTPGHYTTTNEFQELFHALPDDPTEIAKFIKRLMIHPLEAKKQNVSFNYKKAVRGQLDYRSMHDILSEPNIRKLLSQQTPNIQSSPAQRGIFSCDHHAVFFAAILRLKGKPVRARCGYASYLIPDMYTPHWICEVYNESKGIWSWIDPEQELFGLGPDKFYPAGRVWLALQNKQLALEKILPDYRDGMDGVKYRLLNDLNALMKNELLNYDWLIKEALPQKPALFSKSVAQLGSTEIAFLNHLAEISSVEEPNCSTIDPHYRTYVHPENCWGTEPKDQ